MSCLQLEDFERGIGDQIGCSHWIGELEGGELLCMRIARLLETSQVFDLSGVGEMIIEPCRIRVRAAKVPNAPEIASA